MNSQTAENYLKALALLSGDRGEVSVNDLSKALAIKMPTVTSMMKKLADKKLVLYESYKPLRLTERGKREANLIIRKHRLTEMFLVEQMGFGWEEVHEIAEQVEHIDAPRFFERIDEMLGHPQLDPHGSPIPDKQGRMTNPRQLRLSECTAGDRVILCGVQGSGSDFLRYLNSKALALGTALHILSVEAFDGTITVKYNNKKESLSSTVCQRLYVERAS